MSHNGHAGRLEWIHKALDRYEGQLTRYAQRITGDSERARDVVQETFLRLCREPSASLDGHLAEWLFTVCRNQALDVCRKESRMTLLTEPERVSTEIPAHAPPDVVASQDEAAHVLKLVGNLPDNQREAIRLRFENDLSYAEIAQVTGTSRGNVGLLIHRGLTTLRQKLKQSK